jgi:hypothetical protein
MHRSNLFISILMICLTAIPMGNAGAATVNGELWAPDDMTSSPYSTGWGVAFSLQAKEEPLSLTAFVLYLPQNTVRGFQVQLDNGAGGWDNYLGGGSAWLSVTGSGRKVVTLDNPISMAADETLHFRVIAEDKTYYNGNPRPWSAYIDPAVANPTDGAFDDSYITMSTCDVDYHDGAGWTTIADQYWYGGIQYEYDDGTPPVPLPTSVLLLGGGLLALVGWRRRGR